MIFKISEIHSNSMEPNFHEGNYYIVKKNSDTKKIKRFDVLVYFCKIHNLNHIKRVIGLPNEKLLFKGKEFFIDNKFIKTFSISDSIRLEFEIGNNSLFLLSDNLSLFGKSCDSIKNGPIEKENIIGFII